MSITQHIQRIAQLGLNESVTLEGSSLEALNICNTIQAGGFKVEPLTTSEVVVTRITMPNQRSASKLLEEQLRNFDGTPVVPVMLDTYARVAVSRYNKKHGTKFSVRNNNGITEVYQDIMDRQFIRQSEYNEYRAKLEEDLETLYTRIKPDGFFPEKKPVHEQIINQFLNKTIDRAKSPAADIGPAAGIDIAESVPDSNAAAGFIAIDENESPGDTFDWSYLD